jgi:LmbE family N-acetylglucosaminyl deacetylase
VRELWYWGADEPDIIVDITDSIDKQVAALIRHESQVAGLYVQPGETIEDRVKNRAAEVAQGHDFTYGEIFRRLIARR